MMPLTANATTAVPVTEISVLLSRSCLRKFHASLGHEQTPGKGEGGEEHGLASSLSPMWINIV